jgi:small subunit ribosomal protein S3|uniref:Small ribosomal subunit protein uS3c n=1 Tax=Pseudochloris wilhelmii TaxID=1418016 RepID=A0A097KQS4_9CHLO|nr:ribosomal protein S3 [Pseudochloris wilhelmii]AIT95538.1 ribosomal protein S3 [Pseudochloris wilhelmii]
MGQKVHPLGFRLGITQKHQSYWCTNPKRSVVWIQDASFIRNFLEKTYNGAGITSIVIQRRDIDSPSITVDIHAARPAVFAGRDQTALDKLRSNLVAQLYQFYRRRNLDDPGKIHLNLFITPLTEPDRHAHVLAEKLVEDLEQRKPYRRAMKQTVQRAIKAGVKGIKIQVAGRLNGADIARGEEVREGPVPLQTLRADIAYSSKPAKTIYGLLGVKIWVFNGERLTRLSNIPFQQKSTQVSGKEYVKSKTN